MTRAPHAYRTIQVPESRRDEVFELDRLAFALTADPEVDAVVPDTLDWDRTMAVEQADGQLCAVHASHRFSLAVPGSAVACAGLTWVGVRPDHRRRGLLTSMIATHFDRSLARGEPVSALFAAEAGIYGRFGYGSAADNLRLTVPRGAALRPVAGSAELDLRLESADEAAHGALIHDLHEAAASTRPGWIARTPTLLRSRHLADPRAWRDGAEQLRIAVVSDASEVRGYALFRRKESWSSPAGPTGTVRVSEVAALDPAATHRLWSFLLDLDLMTTVESPMLATDDALVSLLVNARAAAGRVSDNLWVRLLDLPVALGARRYATPLDVVLEVTDSALPANAGRWHVRTDPSGTSGTAVTADTVADGGFGHPAEVRATDAPADLTVDVRELGAAYLGGRSLAALASAGLVVEHRAGALLRTSAAFGWPVAPVCGWVF
ncbi:GNAT family N-acetyltransferase [Pengzhenrongella frigida]|uniref:GNAT family N-acetyltransferase n=1 Tax=Pengzhenrongella frigida TaxID=1259133 RepID=A0A4Q5N4S9_9MICO|nr:GNAT family N-acetyltransferase [Cellulomonas sp. HLT2-17]RYV52383.1 GNAT family N-acetyltransferase [Cellulomonas sp. HLT2-17]